MSERGLADTGCFQQPVVSEKQESDCCGGSFAIAFSEQVLDNVA